MMDSQDKQDTQTTGPAAVRGRPVHDNGSDAAFELNQIRVVKPLRIAEEDPGGDPYNRTGRFTVDD
jgi:hypothetical protein